MTHKEIIDYCLKKPGAYVDFPFEPWCPTVRVKAPSQEKGPIFANPLTLKGELKVSLSCTPESAEVYRAIYPGTVVRGWHCPPVQQPHCNTVSLDGTVPDDVILRMIDHAYDVVVAKMPKYIQKELCKGEQCSPVTSTGIIVEDSN